MLPGMVSAKPESCADVNVQLPLLFFVRAFESFEVPALVGLAGNINVMTTTIFQSVHRTGMPSYGAASNFFDLEDMRAHGRDERIKADRFAEGSEFAYRLMKAFSTAGAP